MVLQLEYVHFASFLLNFIIKYFQTSDVDIQDNQPGQSRC